MWLATMVRNLGRNVAGLMLGFSIYVASEHRQSGSAKAFGSALFTQMSLDYGAPGLCAVSTGLDHIPLGTCAGAKT